MLTLTPPIGVPNIARAKVLTVHQDPDEAFAIVRVQAMAAGPRVQGIYRLEIRDGIAQGLRETPLPQTFLDAIQVFTATTADKPAIATAYTDVIATYNTTAGSTAVRLKAVETLLSAAAMQLLPPGSVA